jgi:hypothetical protein
LIFSTSPTRKAHPEDEQLEHAAATGADHSKPEESAEEKTEKDGAQEESKADDEGKGGEADNGEVNKPEEDVKNSQTDVKRAHKPDAPKRVDGVEGE